MWMMTRFHNKIALVTGAGSGIGRATSLALGRKGCGLVLCDIDPDGLEETRALLDEIQPCLLALTVDVGDREAMEIFARQVLGEYGTVDILVNNAGVASGGPLKETTLDDWEWSLRVNLWGVIYGCQLFIPAMIERGQGGHVVNIASVSGLMAGGDMSVYSTGKFGVVGLSQSLRRELHPEGISVSTICPGIVSTNIMRGARLKGVEGTDTEARLRSMLEDWGRGPEAVARAVVDAIIHDRGVVTVGSEAHLFYGLQRFAPGLMDGIDRFFRGLLKP